MKITEVTNLALEREFIQVNVKIYAKDPNYIRPLDKDILDVFNEKKNTGYWFGFCNCCWNSCACNQNVQVAKKANNRCGCGL